MSNRNKQRTVTTASASATSTVDVAAVADRSRLESLLFDSPAADCSDCTNPDCPDRRLRLHAEADATAMSASSSAPAPSPTQVAAPGPRKKCSQCSRDRPESAFSNAQLKLKGRRQCRDCIDPICTVCGEGDSARAVGAPPASPATSTLRPLLVKTPRPAADFVIMSHYSCAKMLSGRIIQNASPATITDVPAGLCAILTSHCAHCDRDGGALQCGGCSRVYHGACGGALRFANPKEGSVYPSHMRGCPHCTSQLAPLQSDISSSDPSASVCAACGFADGGFQVVTEWTRDWNRLQPVRVEMKPNELLLPMHIGCARRLTDLNSAQLVMPTADSSDAPLLKNLSAHLQAALVGSCASCQKPGGTARCSDCSCRFHHLCLGMQLNRIDDAFAIAPMRSCPVCTQSLRIIDRPALDAAVVDALATSSITGELSAAPAAAAGAADSSAPSGCAVAVASAAATAGSSSSSSSSSAASSSSSTIPAGSKKCAHCHLHLAESDYSASQLKAKGKRQCKTCVAQVQSLQALSSTDAEAKIFQSRISALVPRLCSPLESEQVVAVCEFTALFNQLDNSAASFIIDDRVATRLVSIMAGASTNELRMIALACVRMTATHDGHGSAVVAHLVSTAGAIPFIVSTLQRPESQGGVHKMCLQMLLHIAETSRGNCDVVLAAGALDGLLPLVRSDIPVDLYAPLVLALACLMRGRPVAEMADAVTRIGSVLMDGSAPPEFLCAFVNALGQAVTSFAHGDPNLESWVESILAAAPGFPQRLIELLRSKKSSKVANSAQKLIAALFCADTGQLRQLFDCGLRDMLLRRLNDAGNETAHCGAVNLCTNAAGNKAGALTLIDSAPIVQRLLALLSTSQGEMLYFSAAFFSNAMSHFDRHMTRRLVDEYRFLPPLVAALRRATQSGDQAVSLLCLRTVAGVLTVGKAEAEDDERGINPYIEPLDWLGVFELADPLQSSSNSELAEVATRVFDYFIPNDCD